MSQKSESVKSRKLALALALDPRTPRRVSLRGLRLLFTFDLLGVTLAPGAPVEIKRAAEEQILKRLESLTLGERVSLARRASQRLAERLLWDQNPRVIAQALDNSRLAEASVVTALGSKHAPDFLFRAVCDHPKWSARREVRLLLVRSERVSLADALRFARDLPAHLLSEIAPESRRASLVAASRP